MKLFWTYEKCKEEALKYSTRSEFKKKSASAYNSASRNGWVDSICLHMTCVFKPSVYWTYEKCKEEALKYSTRSEFQKKSASAYNSALRNGWLNDVCSHMKFVLKPSGYWTYEKCKEEALKYKNRKDFCLNSKGCYDASYKNGWLDDICSHMKYIFRPNGYWTYEKCKEFALSCKTLEELRKSHAYDVILKNNWYDKICGHLVRKSNPKGYWTYEKCKEEVSKYEYISDLYKNGKACIGVIKKNKWDKLLLNLKHKCSLKNRYIYAFEFSDRSVYVGLTYDLEKRKIDHLTSKKNISQVFSYINKTGLFYIFKNVYDKSFDTNLAGEMEKITIENYKKNGWNILNKSKGGSLGAINVKWTYERLKKEKINCKTVSDFRKKIKPHVISKIRKNGWYNDFFYDLIDDSRVKWNFENASQEMKKYKNIKEIQKKRSGLYKFLYKHNMLNSFYKIYEKKDEKTYFYLFKKENIKNGEIWKKKYKQLSKRDGLNYLVQPWSAFNKTQKMFFYEYKKFLENN